MKCHVRKRLQTVLERKPNSFVFRTTLRLKSLLLARIIHETGNHRQFARRKVEWSVIGRMSDV